MFQDSIAESIHGPAVLVIFGASGDLTRRKIIPALYNLFLDRWLPPQFRIIGFARTAMEPARMEALLKQKLKDRHDDFKPGPDYIAQWGYKVVANGTAPIK